MVKSINKSGLLVVLLLLIMSSCMPRMRSSKGLPPAKYLETFYKGNGKTLYFVKPFDWKQQDGKDELSMDLTHNFDADSITDVTVNFTFHTEKPVKSLETATFRSAKNTTEGLQLARMYAEPGKKAFNNRFTMKIAYNDLVGLVDSEEPEFRLKYKAGERIYRPGKKWKKLRGFVQRYMVGMIELARDSE